MSCLCQYFVTSKNRKPTDPSTDGSDVSLFTPNTLALAVAKAEAKQEANKLNEEISATELAAAKAEIWVLKKNLNEAQISIENLENLVRTIILKQNELLGEMYELKNQNYELQDECRMQRDYQMMERNAMMREMQEIKTLLGDRTRILILQQEDTVTRNSELTSALQDANEKIYMMGMKFLKLKASRSKHVHASNTTSGSNTERSNSG
ncbi:uncharacterized protein LOC101460496 isoform X1 [Ceratitis capitata]|uniref:uncharacterized protein LOC101460496 isoform X1 n=1 Tax=Ceratitis capitata TaxID=7213 RepID=UPI0006188F74|nr:uncharacterized protein LOC101460496 isoform X1 [Ceratitis capitata]